MGNPDQKQHVEAYHKEKLRRRLLDNYRGRLGASLTAYVPFIGDGDLALSLYHPLHAAIFGADTDPARVTTSRERFPAADIREADCDQWPFPDISVPFNLADFDAYSNPYLAFKAFWQHATKADAMLLFFTDGHRQAILRTHHVWDFEADAFSYVPEPNDWRPRYNRWLDQYVRPWFDAYIRPYRVVDLQSYLRSSQVYWGALIALPEAHGAGAAGVATDATGEKKEPTGAEMRMAERKKLFLEGIREGRTVLAAAKKAGVERKTPSVWANKDDRFKVAWLEAQRAGGDAWEDMLTDAAVSGNITAIIVGLKMKGRFTERQIVTVEQKSAVVNQLLEELPAEKRELVLKILEEAMSDKPETLPE